MTDYSLNERHVLRSKRLVLEPTGRAHTEGLSEAIEASLAELRRWMPWSVDATESSTRDYVEHAERAWQSEESYNFTVLHDGVVAGSISLMRGNPVVKIRDMGYWLRSDLSGRGLMTEAASAVVEFGFARLRLHRIELQAGVANIASNRVAEKIGFRREGLLRDGCLAADGYYDAYLYGLLEHEPRNRWH